MAVEVVCTAPSKAIAFNAWASKSTHAASLFRGELPPPTARTFIPLWRRPFVALSPLGPLGIKRIDRQARFLPNRWTKVKQIPKIESANAGRKETNQRFDDTRVRRPLPRKRRHVRQGGADEAQFYSNVTDVERLSLGIAVVDPVDQFLNFESNHKKISKEGLSPIVKRDSPRNPLQNDDQGLFSLLVTFTIGEIISRFTIGDKPSLEIFL